MKLSLELRAYAETPDRFAPMVEGSSVSRFDDGRICVIQGQTWASVSAPNVAEHEVEALVAETRALIPADKLTTWWIGPSARPVDVIDRLRALGLEEPHDRVSRLHAMVRTDEPAPIPAGIEVRRVVTHDDFVAAREVQWDAFETPESRREAQRPHLRDDFDESMRFGVPAGFVASLDGRPAATALSIPSARGVFLIAGAVAPWARGRGLYRALVRARWDDAVERGTPALVTQANPETSYPILRRLGFAEVCEIARLEDVR
jgi:ribosomal protein S18 acetylase RimI-like enzyme